ncbi:helix-hairpin-helix domain-containing protein [Gammaproteobacteria bacterium]|nr:helix-hairpin-helix domain-containing protein [Gammaproteobacteria bacterium]
MSAAAAVNINSASAQEIAQALNGMRFSKAHAIVEYPETNDRLNQADKIVYVQGIGDSTHQINRGDIPVR